MFIIDSNVYIQAFVDAQFGAQLQRFHSQYLARIALSAVVASELLIGARTSDRERALRKGLLDPFIARRRLLAPTWATWERASAIDRALRRRHGLLPKLRQRSFFNDMLIAAAAREIGATVITLNQADFSLIAPVAAVKFDAPWPTLP